LSANLSLTKKPTDRSLEPATVDVVEYGRRRVLVVVGVMLATVLQVLDATIVNVALPTIQGNLGANLNEGTWIITGYIIAAVIIIPLTPWLQTRFGRKRYYVAAILGFTLTSVLCGLAQTFEAEVFFRVLQGLCGGGLLPTGQAILRDTFPPKEIGRSQVLVALGAIVGPSVGPTLGGILTDQLSWNWVFYINVVPGLFAATLLILTLRDPAKPQKIPVDLFGLALLAMGLGSLQYVLNEGERNDWFGDARISGFAAVAVLALVGFVAWELFGAKRPIVDLRILGRRTVWAGCLLAMTIGFTLYGSIVITPQFNQGILNFTATMSGESILIRALAILGCTPLVLVFLNRFKLNPRILLGAGFILVAIANLLQAQVTTSQSDFWTFWIPLALGGVGFSQLLAPLSVAVLSTVRGIDTAKASSLLSLSQQLGGSLSTAVLVTMLDRRAAFHQSMLAAGITHANSSVQRILLSVGPEGLQRIYAVVVREANTLAFADAFWMLGIVAFVLAPLVLLIRTQRPAEPVTLAVAE
jgi:DHA2 family multidrug resistance protein